MWNSVALKHIIPMINGFISFHQRNKMGKNAFFKLFYSFTYSGYISEWNRKRKKIYIYVENLSHKISVASLHSIWRSDGFKRLESPMWFRFGNHSVSILYRFFFFSFLHLLLLILLFCWNFAHSAINAHTYGWNVWRIWITGMHQTRRSIFSVLCADFCWCSSNVAYMSSVSTFSVFFFFFLFDTHVQRLGKSKRKRANETDTHELTLALPFKTDFWFLLLFLYSKWLVQ